MGAYLSTAAPGIPTILHGLMLSGPYTVPAVKEDVYGVYTNTTPVEAYRGAGRPEATFMLERMIDKLADELKIDPVEIRQRNLLPPFDNGCDVVTGLNYDSGNYQARARQGAGPHRLQRPARRAGDGARSRAGYLGIGVCTYVEICGLGPSQVAGAVGFQGGLWESAIVRFHPSGKVNVFIGASPHGQGEETTFAQIVADELGVGRQRREGRPRRHRQHADGLGHLRQPHDGRRRRRAGGGHAQDQGEGEGCWRPICSRRRREDIDYEDGKFFVKGAPDRHKTIQDIALMANVAWNMPAGMEAGLEATSFYDPPNFVYPFGAHVAVVEVDRGDRAHVDLKRYVAVDDCGPQINPIIVEGQVHGGRRAGHRSGAVGRRGLRRRAVSSSPDRCSTTRFRVPTCCPTSRCSRP